MEAIKRLLEMRAFYIPVLILAAYFAVDKLCSTDIYKRYSQGDGTYLFYDYKPKLLAEMAEIASAGAAAASASGARDPSGDLDPGEPGFPTEVKPKIFQVLGTSRMLYFDYERFDRNYPEWEMFNFSAPVTAPAYYLYILERTLERGVRPDYILIETDPFQFNESSDAFARSNLAYTFDLRFMLRYFGRFTRDQFSYWLARNLFAGFKYPPHYGNIRSRIGNPDAPFLTAIKILDDYQRSHRGGGKNVIPIDQWFERDFSRLQYSADRSVRWLYGRYRVSEDQFAFLEDLLALAKRHKIQVAMVRPPVSRPLDTMLGESPELRAPLAEFEKRIQALSAEYGAAYLDLGRRDDYYCNTFVDGSHMSIDCYSPMLSLIMSEYWRRSAAGVGR